MDRTPHDDLAPTTSPTTARPAAGAVTVSVDDPLRPDVVALLQDHLDDMHATSPAESVHALDPSALTAPALTFWTARTSDGTLLGTVALKELHPTGGELKSMRTAPAARGRGIGTVLLGTALAEAAARGYRTVHLETGTHDFFAPAHRLYARAGFVPCGPFGDYRPDPHSAFFLLDLATAAAG